MAAPHIAGIAALIKQKHPNWSPMAIKSAIMTTAYQLTRTGKTGQPFGTPLQYGAGHVDPWEALDPGLVFESGLAEWQAFLCGADSSQCDGRKEAAEAMRARQHYMAPKDATEPSSSSTCTRVEHLNTPSITGDTAGALRVKRTLTAVLGDNPRLDRRPVRFESMAKADAGSAFDIQVWPQEFEVSDGDSVDVWITIAAGANTVLETPQSGQIVWRSREGHRVAIPVVVTFTAFEAPDLLEVDLSSFSEKPTYSTSYPISSARPVVTNLSTDLQPATILSGALDLDFETAVFDFTLPPGPVLGIARLYAQDYASSTDLDLSVYKKQADGTFSLVGGSYSFTSDEAVIFVGPGEYKVVAELFGGPGSTINLYLWTLALDGSSAQSLMTVTPSKARLQTPLDPCHPQVTMTVSGVEETASGGLPNRYMGAVTYWDTTTQQLLASTYVSVA